jgi:hypothetical protein
MSHLLIKIFIASDFIIYIYEVLILVLWILISAVTLLVLLGFATFFMFKFKKKEREPDYRIWFIMGITWIHWDLQLKTQLFGSWV